MELDIIKGNLTYQKLFKKGTLQHVDQITNLRRNATGDDQYLRVRTFHLGDGMIYSKLDDDYLLSVTREPQNIILQNIDDVDGDVNEGKSFTGSYYCSEDIVKSSMNHPDTLTFRLKALELDKDYGAGYNDAGKFYVNPKKLNKLSHEQKRFAQRIYGPDEESFGLNIEMFERFGIVPSFHLFKPEHLERDLFLKEYSSFCTVPMLGALLPVEYMRRNGGISDGCCVFKTYISSAAAFSNKDHYLIGDLSDFFPPFHHEILRMGERALKGEKQSLDERSFRSSKKDSHCCGECNSKKQSLEDAVILPFENKDKKD